MLFIVSLERPELRKPPYGCLTGEAESLAAVHTICRDGFSFLLGTQVRSITVLYDSSTGIVFGSLDCAR